jgi:hypothetical protein
MIVIARMDVELAIFQHRSLVDGQGFRTTQTSATNRPFKPGCDLFGFGLVPIED